MPWTKSDSDPSRPEGNLQPIQAHTCALGNAYKHIPDKRQKLTKQIHFAVRRTTQAVNRISALSEKLGLAASFFSSDCAFPNAPILRIAPLENTPTRGKDCCHTTG
jgi:hypothetical protein